MDDNRSRLRRRSLGSHLKISVKGSTRAEGLSNLVVCGLAAPALLTVSKSPTFQPSYIQCYRASWCGLDFHFCLFGLTYFCYCDCDCRVGAGEIARAAIHISASCYSLGPSFLACALAVAPAPMHREPSRPKSWTLRMATNS